MTVIRAGLTAEEVAREAVFDARVGAISKLNLSANARLIAHIAATFEAFGIPGIKCEVDWESLVAHLKGLNVS